MMLIRDFGERTYLPSNTAEKDWMVLKRSIFIETFFKISVNSVQVIEKKSTICVKTAKSSIFRSNHICQNETLLIYSTSGSNQSLIIKEPIKFVKSVIFPSALAFSSAFIYSGLLSTGITVHSYPPEISMTFIKKRPILPFPSI